MVPLTYQMVNRIMQWKFYLWMMSTRKEAYQVFTESVSDLSVFAQPWFLDAVTQGQWDVIVVERGGQSAAVLPFWVKPYGPWKVVAMPPLCKFMGPLFAEPFRSVSAVYKLSNQLIAALPKVAVFRQNFHYSYDNWLPFYWAGFRQTTRYSYVLDSIADLDGILAGFSTDYRNAKIARADSQMELAFDLPVTALDGLLTATYARQGLKSGVSVDLMTRILDAARAQNAGRMMFALDRQGHVHAGLMMLRDRHSASLLLAADNPDLRQSGAGIWLIWQAIRYASLEWKVERFDFLGSVKQSIERSRRQFGARPVPYFAVERFQSRTAFLIEWARGRR